MVRRLAAEPLAGDFALPPHRPKGVLLPLGTHEQEQEPSRKTAKLREPTPSVANLE